MSLSLIFTRIFFGLLSVFFMVTQMISYPVGSITMKVLTGISLGGSFTLLLIAFDTLFRRFNLRSFNIVIVGLFFGYLMGQSLVYIFDAVLQISSLTINLNPSAIEIIKISMFLLGTYLGTILTLQFADEIYISIPFVRFSQSIHKKKDILIDQYILIDTRLIDFCNSGLLNNQLTPIKSEAS